MTATEAWWAKGLLFENCNCQLMCRAHIRYSNLCDHERCIFSWAIHIDEGAYGACPLGGLNTFILGDTPQRMFDGGWTEAIYLDAAADGDQRMALEAIFKGSAGGPWDVLADFVTHWLETRSVPIHYEDRGRHKSMVAEGAFSTRAEAIRGVDREREVQMVNLYNQIHGPEHVLALGATECANGPLVMSTEKTHAIYSRFAWSGP